MLSPPLAQSQVLCAGFHGGDTKGNVFVEIDAKISGAAGDVVAVHVGRERRLLEFFTDALGFQPVQSGRTDQRAGGNESA